VLPASLLNGAGRVPAEPKGFNPDPANDIVQPGKADPDGAPANTGNLMGFLDAFKAG
jgi:hypothetical protein